MPGPEANQAALREAWAHLHNRAWFAPLLLALAVVAGYANSFHGVFQYDDFKVIVEHTRVHSLSQWQEDIGRGLRPLLKLSYTLNWISGAGESGFHAVNLGLHLIATLLVYRLVTLVLPQQRNMALASALLFAVHPAASEAVTYISGRSMSLMTVFYLAATLTYLKGARDKDWRWLYLWSPLLFVLAVASKETALLMPFTLLLCELCLVRPLRFSDLLRRQALHWLVFLSLVLAVLANAQYREMMGVSAELNGLQTNLLTQLHAMTYLLGQLLLPWHMNIDPVLPVVTIWPQGAFDLAWWIVLATVAAMSWRKYPWLCFAIFWFVLQLLPIYVFLPRIDVLNDRHLYLAGFPILMLVAVALSRLPAHAGAAALAALVLLLTWLSIDRNRDYYSEIALWESTVRLSPNNSRAYNNLGFAYQQAGQPAQAEKAFLTALRLDPNNLRAQNNLARLRDTPLPPR